jgi:hypothetical protein
MREPRPRGVLRRDRRLSQRIARVGRSVVSPAAVARRRSARGRRNSWLANSGSAPRANAPANRARGWARLVRRGGRLPNATGATLDDQRAEVSRSTKQVKLFGIGAEKDDRILGDGPRRLSETLKAHETPVARSEVRIIPPDTSCKKICMSMNRRHLHCSPKYYRNYLVEAGRSA